MNLTLLPLLRIQRDLHDIPRGMERFRAYLATMTEGSDDIVLPITGMNPMGKEHVAALLDDLLAADAEAIASARSITARRPGPGARRSAYARRGHTQARTELVP
jgi:hypothetical protein